MKRGGLSLGYKSALLAFLLSSLFCLGGCLKQNNLHHPAGGGVSNGGTGKATTPADPTTLTFNDILPIFLATCQGCHNKTSGVTQPNWQDYEIAKLYKDSIKKRLTEKTMPPIGSPLSDQDRRKILDWIEAGAPNAPTTNPPPTPTPEPPPTPPIPVPVPGPVPPPPPPPPSVDDPIAKIFQGSCIGCHGAYSAGLKSPIIFGLPPGYIFMQLLAYKTKTRVDSLMSGAMESVSANLTEEEMGGLANYVSELSPCLIPDSVVDPGQGNISEGEVLANDKGCLGCHNFGNAKSYPSLAGQKAHYLNQQLLAFKSGTRKNNFMNAFASNLTESDILNLAAYFNSLGSCQK